MNIPFNKPASTGNEKQYVLDALSSGKMSGDGVYTKKCHEWFQENLGCKKSLLTPSCTHALEMSAILLNIREGDEVIMPSYTFPSTANAFVLRGAKVVFVDVRQDTMNLDEKKINQSITSKTKAIVVVHYAGVACEMDTIMRIANKYCLYVVEDAAQAMMSTYKGRPLGTIGHMGVLSFHETKNYTSAGEGGLIIINDEQFINRAEIIREKGTNRSQFFRGQVDKYSWVDIGSSYLPNEVSAAYLWGQLEKSEDINDNRLESWGRYYAGLTSLFERGLIKLPVIPQGCIHNAHMFYIRVKNVTVRDSLLNYLHVNDVLAIFHYVPLHSSIAGSIYGRFHGCDENTTAESEKIIRLPLYYGLDKGSIDRVISLVEAFFSESK